jgi:hypothetical protein
VLNTREDVGREADVKIAGHRVDGALIGSDAKNPRSPVPPRASEYDCERRRADRVFQKL